MEIKEQSEILRWPAWMPVPIKDDYSYQAKDNRTITETEVGNIIRVEFAGDETAVSCTLVASPVEVAWLECFERDLLHQGASWFEMPMLTGGAVQFHTVRLKSKPTLGKLHGEHIRVSLELELKRREPTLCLWFARLMLHFSLPQLETLHSTVHSVINETAPLCQIPAYWMPQEVEDVEH